MFVFKWAFWLLMVLLVLPNDSRRSQTSNREPSAPIHDLPSFCNRHERLCISPGQAVVLLKKKAVYAYGVARDAAALISSENQFRKTFVQGWREEKISQNKVAYTLTTQDREPAWHTSDYPGKVE